MENPVESHAGNRVQWRSDELQKVLVGKIEHPIRRCGPNHRRYQIDNGIGFRFSIHNMLRAEFATFKLPMPQVKFLRDFCELRNN
jgi:uncharacterized protein with von Willebrand factor type A (vWA) domain